MNERLRRLIAHHRRPIPTGPTIDCRYRPAWRPDRPDFLDRLILDCV